MEPLGLFFLLRVLLESQEELSWALLTEGVSCRMCSAHELTLGFLQSPHQVLLCFSLGNFPEEPE